MLTRPLFVAFIATLPSLGEAVVIDDFTAGAITVATSGERFDEVAATQTGLATDHVAFGGRQLHVQQRDDPVTLQVDASDTGRLTYHTDGQSGINTYLFYDADDGIDLSPNGENTLVLEFESLSFDNPRLPLYPDSGFLDLTVRSTEGGAYQYVRLPSSAEPFTLAIPFSLLGSLDPSEVTRLELGTGNGNLDGTFALASITTEQLAPADYNGDGSIDTADYTVWRDSLAPRNGYVYRGDGNADGRVDPADLVVWQAAYGGSGTAAVPEPTSAVLALVVALPVTQRPRR